MLTTYHDTADEQRGLVTGNAYADLIALLLIGGPVLMTPDPSGPDRYFLEVTGTHVKTRLERDPAAGSHAIIRLYFLAR